MKTILDTIREHKSVEVLHRKGKKSLKELENKPLYNQPPLNPLTLFSNIESGIIAEFKRKSPSKGMLAKVPLDPVQVVAAYKEGGAVCSSILTDRKFFGGSFKDLENVKFNVPGIPLLRKDFIIDPYQVHEAKAYGADVILLIAAILSKEEIASLAKLARSLGLSVLLEVHTKAELDSWIPGIDLVGVNNRNLKDFTVDIRRSLELSEYMPREVVRISESGIKKPEDVKQLQQAGFSGFLMGERFMAEENPGQALSDFIAELKS